MNKQFYNFSTVYLKKNLGKEWALLLVCTWYARNTSQLSKWNNVL